MALSVFLLPHAKGFEGYVFTCVCHSVKGCLPQCILRYTTPDSRHPLGSRHLPTREANTLPRRQTHPQEADTSQPGKQTLSPEGRHTPRKQTPPLGSRHPSSSACWEIWPTSGWYASYWNAFCGDIATGPCSLLLSSLTSVSSGNGVLVLVVELVHHVGYYCSLQA